MVKIIEDTVNNWQISGLVRRAERGKRVEEALQV